MTFHISFLPSLNLPESPPEDAIITPATIIKTNEKTRIAVTTILLKAHINTGNAFCFVTMVVFVSLFVVSSLAICIQFQINGTLVFSLIPHLQSEQSSSSFVVSPSQLSGGEQSSDVVSV